MIDVSEFIEVAIEQSEALQVAGELLGRIATSKSSYADEAMAALSHVVTAQHRARKLVTPKPTPLGGK